MARRKFYRSRRRYNRRRGYGSRRSYGKRHKFVQRTSFTLAQKFFDYSYTDSILGTADMAGLELDEGTYLHLTPVASGSGVSTRNGRGIILKSVYIQGWLVTDLLADPDSVGVTPRYVTLAVVLDKKTNGNQVSSEDVWLNTGADAARMTPVRNLYQARNYHILVKKTIRIDIERDADGTNYHTYASKTPFKIGFRCSIPQTYSDTGANIASVTDNSLHLIGWTNYAPSDVSNPLYENVVSARITVRFRFLDNC